MCHLGAAPISPSFLLSKLELWCHPLLLPPPATPFHLTQEQICCFWGSTEKVVLGPPWCSDCLLSSWGRNMRGPGQVHHCCLSTILLVFMRAAMGYENNAESDVAVCLPPQQPPPPMTNGNAPTQSEGPIGDKAPTRVRHPQSLKH